MLTRIRPRAISRTSARAGIRSPAKRGLNQAPASRRWSSANVFSVTFPLPVVVRSSVSSWITTTSLSRVRWTSNSILSLPAAIAAPKAARVFSGACPENPRWAVTTTGYFPLQASAASEAVFWYAHAMMNPLLRFTSPARSSRGRTNTGGESPPGPAAGAPSSRPP